MITNIALGMIYKDDEWSLERTLPAYAHTFDERLMITFGEIPRGLRNWDVVLEAWPESYARARNNLLTIATAMLKAPWLLMLDADEAMFPDDLCSLSRWVESCTADAVYFPRINFGRTPATWLSDNYPDYQTRLIRLGSDVHYVNAVHECSAGAKPRALAPYHIYHYGLCRPPEVVFERWRSYAALDGKAAPAQMPAGFDEYVGLGRQEAFMGEHPLDGAERSEPVQRYIQTNPSDDAQLTSNATHRVHLPYPQHASPKPRYTPYRLR